MADPYAMPTPGWNLPYGVSSRDFDDPPVGTCPTCGMDTYNGEEDADEDGVRWTWNDCDECASACPCCAEMNCEKDDDGYCQSCQDNHCDDVSWARMHRARNLLDETRALLARFI